MKQILYKRARTAIRNWGDKFVNDIKRQLNIDRTVASQRTRNSIEGKLKADEQLSADELSNFLETKLAKFKIPEHYLFQIDQLPRIASGKIAKKQLREEAIKLLS